MARIVRIIDLGIQTTTFKDKNGNLKKPHQLTIGFEIPSQKTDDGRPLMIYTKNLSFSLGYAEFKTKLREYAEAILGQEIHKLDVAELLGKAAMISVAHTPSVKDPTKKYAVITGVMQIPAGIAVADAYHPLINFSISEFNKEVFDGLEEWLRKKIALPAGINLSASSNDGEQDVGELLA